MTGQSFLVVLVATLCAVNAAPAGDLVTSIPGFPTAPFKLYSGYLHVPGPVAGYDSLDIHYEFHESQNDPANDPVSTWHQGGPGGSSLYGCYGEMGYFQLGDGGNFVNNYSWNKVSNMLYLESPAGSGDPIGFSDCHKDGKPAPFCEWDDVTQAEAYAATLVAFNKAFPEYAKNDLYITGESYAGQYVPNIAHFILNNSTYNATLNLKGIAVGNGCWGGDEHHVQCNGPNSEQNDVDMYFGKGLVSKPLYESVYKTCKFPNIGPECDALLEKASQEAGPHNVYDIYDNCPNTAIFLNKTGKSMRWLRNYLRENMNDPEGAAKQLTELSGGYQWSCGAMDDMTQFFSKAEVQKALHLNQPGVSKFRYSTSGPASVLLYPEIMKNIRVLIYNGDSDSCVPYKGNEEWTESMVTKGAVSKKDSWRPWFITGDKSDGRPPSGYVTSYTVNSPRSGAETSFDFLTIRLAGHMVPTFQPRASLDFFTKWIKKEQF